MKIKQLKVESIQELNITLTFQPNLILCFSSLDEESIQPFLIQLQNQYPNALLAGCSTGGDVLNTTINYSALSLTFVQFENAQIDVKRTELKHSKDQPIKFKNPLNENMLKHILVFTDLQSNDFNFIDNFQKELPAHIQISGGVAAAHNLSKNNNTYIIYQAKTYKDSAVYIGFYGKQLSINCGSHAGWDSFGIERIVTKASGNILYELNGEKALKIYKASLNILGAKLPEHAINYPVSIRFLENERPIIRTVIAINEENQSIEFAGDIPLHCSLKLMKGNIDRIIIGAQKSAIDSMSSHQKNPQLAIVVSCIGRQVILKHLINEELEIVRETIGETCYLAGFYSYGEFAPISKSSPGVLHNQTMTITTISE